MNCSEAHETFGEAIDGKIPGGIFSALFEHLNACRICRKSFELETITKQIVRNTCSMVVTPPQIFQSVLANIETEPEQPASFYHWIDEFFSMRKTLPALAGTIVVVALLVFFNSPATLEESDVHTASNDIIVQALQNFARLQRGELKPTRTATKPGDVHDFLNSSGMNFAIVQSIDCCRKYGATTSEYGGVKLAHVVYTMDDDVMYVYEVLKRNVMEGSTLIMPPAARTALRKTGWYTDPHHPECNVILWISDETLCAAVSYLKKDQMLALLNRN